MKFWDLRHLDQGWVGKTFYSVLPSFAHFKPMLAIVKLGKIFG